MGTIETTREVTQENLRLAPRRVEGHRKVRGEAVYVGDYDAARIGSEMDVAVLVTSAQATGSVIGIQAELALASPGVRAVITHENAPRLHKVFVVSGTEIADILPLQQATLSYAGQCVAMVVADTLEHARTGALLVEVVYSQPNIERAFTLDQGLSRAADAKKVGGGEEGHVEIGHPEHAYGLATHRVDLNFETQPHHHNAMEPAGVVAVWDADGGLTVHTPSQFCYGDAVILGEAFEFGLKDRLPRMIAGVIGGFQFDSRVRVITPVAGGAFGGKQANIHLLLAPMAAKFTGRPVKLILTREQTFTQQPFRGATQQRLRLGADINGKLEAILHDASMAQGAGGSFVEPTIENTAKAYACENILAHSRTARLDTNAPGWMRAPGSSVGQFALEVAMDSLAEKAGLDPLEIRLRNYAETDPETGHEWSSKSLRQCYAAAAERIGWHRRNPEVGSMREGRSIVGFGMATSMYPTRQMPAVARLLLHPNGRAEVHIATHEIGQGTITSMTQIAAERLGLPMANVGLHWGDTSLPFGSPAFGSLGALSNGAAIVEAADMAVQDLYQRVVEDESSPLYQQHVRDLRINGSEIVGAAGRSESVINALRRLTAPITQEAITGRDFGRSKYARYAFGAQFAKVSIDPATMHIHVDRLVGAFAGGRAINPLMVRSQLLGGMVWGLGQALMEESSIDTRSGLWMNPNLGEALVPVNADVAGLEVILLEEDDTRAHPLGAKGMGEIGVVGVAPAISNAIYHATGRRLCSLPMRLDDLL